MIFLVKSRKDPEQKISAWEAQYHEKPHADLILGPFECLAHLVLQNEHRLARLDPKDDTDRGIGFGVRSIVGVYLGVHVDPVTMFYTYLMTDGKNVYTSKNNIITTGDIFLLNITVNSREKWRKWISLTGSHCWPSASANHRQTG